MTAYTITNDGFHAFGVKGTAPLFLSVRGFATELDAAAWIAGQQASEAMAAAAMIPLNPATYDSEIRRMVGPHGEARLTRSEHTVLMCLARRRGMLVTWDALVGALWEPDNEPEAALNAVKVYICRLRAKLRRVGEGAMIETVWGAGFVLSAPTTSAAAVDRPAPPSASAAAAWAGARR
jgi:DNA-binding response OmpR family regulator